jgi:hypothetical protein
MARPSVDGRANLCLEHSAINMNRHCEPSAAIQRHQSLDCRASLAMTGGAHLTHDALAQAIKRLEAQ